MNGGDTQLFVDDAGILRKEGVTRTAHACRKLDAPVLQAEAPWEADRIDRRVYLYGTVLRQPDGSFRMWYMHATNRFLYATSADGVHWTRPNLGLVSFSDSKANNILPIALHSPSLIVDPRASDPAQRYKLLGCDTAPGPKRGYSAAHSSDGLDWQLHPKNPVLPGSDTCTLSYDPVTGEFLAFHKLTHMNREHKRRLVYLAVSRDMQSWSEPELVLAPDDIDDEQTRREGGICSHFYNLSAFPYGSQWLGLVTHFRHLSATPAAGTARSGQDGPIDVQLVHSRDGRTWSRCEDRTPVIPNGPHAYDAGCILGVANQPVMVGDEVWVYYTAITTTHGGAMPEKQVSIARAVWRRDGWVSLDAGAGGGVVETIPLPPGRLLTVNADAAAGNLTVEILAPGGLPLPDYTHQDCVPLRGDGIRQPVRWKHHATLPTCPGIRLRFRMNNARLYSYSNGGSALA